MASRKLRFTVGVVVLFAVAATTAKVGWDHYVQSAKEATAIKTLHQIPAASTYPNAVTYQGTGGGFHSVTIASIVGGQNSVTAGVAGSWVLTYTGNNPPSVREISLTGTVQHTQFYIMVRGFHPSTSPTRIGPHRYLYYETQWNDPAWPFRVTQSQAEFQTSVASIRLISGQVVTVRQQSPKDKPYFIGRHSAGELHAR